MPVALVRNISAKPVFRRKVHTALTQRLSRVNTHDGARRERHRVELHGLLEYDVDMRSQAVADVMPRGFQVQDSCVAPSGRCLYKVHVARMQFNCGEDAIELMTG